MEQASVTSRPVAVEITRTFAAPREKVFRAWTDANELACWFAPSPDYTIVVPELELRVGGRYVVEMHHKGGNVHLVGGTYREVLPPEKISFTWRWEGNEARDASHRRVPRSGKRHGDSSDSRVLAQRRGTRQAQPGLERLLRAPGAVSLVKALGGSDPPQNF